MGRPSGISAIKALSEEKIFDRVKLFERRERVGGTWLYDEHPEPFSAFSQQPKPQPPAQLPRSTPSGPENLTARTGNYATLDSNVGSEVMAFTYKPFPVNNSASSIHRLGNNNYTKPWQAVANYLEEIAEPFSHLISLNTHVEDIRKIDGKWTLTLRRTDYDLNGEKRDYWWQEKFDAVIVATGHYSVPHTPKISGLDETSRTVPKAFEHSKAFRSPDHYVNKVNRLLQISCSISLILLPESRGRGRQCISRGHRFRSTQYRFGSIIRVATRT